jgi:flagellar protein FlaI
MAKIDMKNRFLSASRFKVKLPRSGNPGSSSGRKKPAASAKTVVVEKPPEAPLVQVPSSFKEVFPLIEPYAYSAITEDPATGGMLYYVIEPTLLEEDKALLNRIRDILVEELDVDVRKIPSKGDVEKLLRTRVETIIKAYKMQVEAETLEKLMYYLTRDFVNLGKIEPLMRDHMIEDIGCDGPSVPIYIWHRQYESMPTNIKFENHRDLDNYIVKLAYLCNKHISIASPMVDGGLPDGSRLQLTYAKEVTRHGSTFSVRRFKADPLTITDLITFNTLTAEMGAFFWYAVEKKACILIGGGTASGKTTLLNCISMFILPDDKIVTIEDTAELNIPHQNWISSIARIGFGAAGSAAEITLFDLLKAAMRQRPDYVIVGEARGEEAFTLFQAMATGHGGLSSLHADSILAVLRRLESAPLNIPRTLIPTLNLIGIQARLKIGDRPARRLFALGEVLGIDATSGEIDQNDIYKWDPRTDSFAFSGRSHTLERLAERSGVTMETVREELSRRKVVLEYLAKKNIRRYKEVGGAIREYYADPVKTFEKARLGLLAIDMA